MSEQSFGPFDSNLIRQAGQLWEKATHSSFLEGICDGTLSKEVFNRWLVQDYHFVTAFLRFVSVLLSRSDRPQQSVLVQGIVALDEELVWFEKHAEARGLDLESPVHPVCRRYNDMMLRAVHEESLSGLYAMLYGIEACYLAAWSSLKPEGSHQEFIERWSHPRFRDYVVKLRRLTESQTDATCQGLFDQCLRYEKDFWSMAMNG
jgi:thiaminase